MFGNICIVLDELFQNRHTSRTYSSVLLGGSPLIVKNKTKLGFTMKNVPHPQWIDDLEELLSRSAVIWVHLSWAAPTVRLWKGFPAFCSCTMVFKCSVMPHVLWKQYPFLLCWFFFFFFFFFPPKWMISIDWLGSKSGFTKSCSSSAEGPVNCGGGWQCRYETRGNVLIHFSAEEIITNHYFFNCAFTCNFKL